MDASALESAESWLAVFWWAKLVAAGLVALGVAMEFGGDWISRPFEKTVEDARKLELAELHKQSDEAKVETARLSKEAETARKETAQAKLELQRLKNPRSITPDALKAELENKPKGKAIVLYVKECSDCEWLSFWLVAGLHHSGWELANSAPMPLPPTAVNSILSSPAASAGGQPWGVSVVANTNADGSVQSALMWALTRLLGENGHGGVDKTLPDGFVRVIVAPRP